MKNNIILIGYMGCGKTTLGRKVSFREKIALLDTDKMIEQKQGRTVSEIFDTDDLIVDWLTQYSEIKDATYVRGFLGRMLFAGEDGVKKMRVLSGGEKVRVLLSRMMIMGSNVLMFDEPTDHLDMESITALNNGMIKFPGVILFACRDHQVVQTTANRIIEFLPDGTMIDKVSTYDEYLESDVMARKRQVYTTSTDDEADD